MRFLVDNVLSPVLATLLERAGHDALHVRAIELHRSDDVVIFGRAAAEDRIVVSADTDFATLLATRSAQKPSVIQFEARAAASRKRWLSRFCQISLSLSTRCKAAASSHSSRHAFGSVPFRSTSRRSKRKSFARRPPPTVDDFVVRESLKVPPA